MVALLLVFALGFGVSAIFSYGEAYGTLKELSKRTLEGQARELLAALRFRSDGGVEVGLPVEWENAYQRLDKSFAYSVFDANGRAVALSSNLATPLPLVGPGELNRLQVLGPKRLTLLAVRAPGGHTVAVARSHPDQEALAESLVDENFVHPFVIVPFILSWLPVIGLMSLWSLRPLARASLEAQSIGSADLSTRLSVDGLPDEIRPLVEAVNGALDRLAHAYNAERRLRTPITVLDLRLQRAR